MSRQIVVRGHRIKIGDQYRQLPDRIGSKWSWLVKVMVRSCEWHSYGVNHVYRFSSEWVGRKWPRCEAQTRKGTPCQGRAIFGKDRCKYHGGRSTGPITPEGRKRISTIQRQRWEQWRRDHEQAMRA